MAFSDLFRRSSSTSGVMERPEPTLEDRYLAALNELQTATSTLSELENDFDQIANSGVTPEVFGRMEASVHQRVKLVEKLRSDLEQAEKNWADERCLRDRQAEEAANTRKREYLIGKLSAKEDEIKALIQFNSIPFEVRYRQLQSERSAILYDLGQLPTEGPVN